MQFKNPGTETTVDLTWIPLAWWCDGDHETCTAERKKLCDEVTGCSDELWDAE